jgi:hypothetical protein
MADYDSSLPIRTEANADVVASISDSTGANQWVIDTNGIGMVNLSDGTNTLAIAGDGSISVTFPAGSEIKITDGTDDLAINADGSINVVVQDAVAGAEVHVFGTAAAGVPGTPNTVVDYTVTALKTLQLKAAHAGFSGKGKAELKTGPTGSETTKAVWFCSTSSGSEEVTFPQPIEVVAGDKVLLILTNRDNANADVYGFINGNEI